MFTSKVLLKSFLLAFTLFLLFHIPSTEATERQCAGFNQYCQLHSQCCSGSCHSYLMRCTQGYPVITYYYFGPHNNLSKRQAIDTQIETGNASVETKQEKCSSAQCKAIGEKCYQHNECCSCRCHGFLHQCTT